MSVSFETGQTENWPGMSNTTTYYGVVAEDYYQDHTSYSHLPGSAIHIDTARYHGTLHMG